LNLIVGNWGGIIWNDIKGFWLLPSMFSMNWNLFASLIFVKNLMWFLNIM
jgi:hypothetical protein